MLFDLFGKIRRFSAYAIIFGIIGFGTSTLLATPVSAATGINQQLNFQGRLLNAQGAIVPDGYYNVEFKIYQDGTGTVAGNPSGTLKWTEDWLNSASSPVKVVNGYMSVQLGSINPFGSSVDWNQDTIWLSINIGNTNTSCTPFSSCAGDGEMLPMKRLSAVPYALNSAKLGGLTAAGFIQNTTTVQTSTNMTIDGIARVDTRILTPTVDTNTAVALNIGTTNATAINLNQNVTVAAGKSLTLAGGTTANRPASPTEGMLWYDTTTKQLLVYANGAWQADRNSSTKIVAASTASQSLKDGADYVATGTGDQDVINSALTAAAGGKVYLTEGTFTINASISIPNNTTLAGAGAGTVITIANAFNPSDFSAIVNTTTGGNGTGLTIQDLTLDGNRANQTSGLSRGISLSGVGSGSGASAIQGATISNVRANNWYGASGIALGTSSHNRIINNTTRNNGNAGIYIAGSYNTITGNTSQGNVSGIKLINGAGNTITGNATQGNVYGIYAETSSNNTITGNISQGNSSYGLYLLTTANTNTVSGNKFDDNGGSTANNGIYLNASDSNTITGNSITDSSATTTNYAINISNSTSDTNYLASNTLGTGSVNDAGTGTIYGGQFYNSTNYRIQPATNITLGNSSTTTTIQGSLSITPQTSTSTTLLCSNSGVVSTCNSSVLAPTATNFIQNQNAAVQSSSNFWISGTARADTSVLTPLLDATTSGGTLGIGTTNATTLNIATNAAAHTVNIANSASAAQTISIGSTNTGSTAAIRGGAASISLANTGITVTGNTTTSGTISTTAGGAAGAGTQLYATNNYVQSRGENLVTNGTGLLGNNYNFSGFTFDQTEVYAGGGSFRNATYNSSVLNDELLPVDPGSTYQLTLAAKSTTYAAGAHAYFGVNVYDIDGNGISPFHYMKYSGSTDTTLAAPLNPGDTTVTVTDATGWSNSANGYSRNFAWYGYTNGKGYTYPDYTYTRTASSNYSDFSTNGAWAVGGITGNVITLRSAWAGPAVATGAAIRNNSSGGSYKYIAASHVTVPAAWTQYSGRIGGIDTNGTGANNAFPYGTAYVKLVFLMNRDVAGNTTNVSNITFSKNSGVFTAPTAGTIPVVIQGATSQTADLLQVQNSVGTVLSKFDASGNLVVSATGNSSFAGNVTIQGNTGVTLNATTGTTMVCRNASGVLSACSATYLTPTATNFIQNQNAAVQSAATFWISGTARADTSVLTPTVDTATGVTLNIGTATASSVNIGKVGITTTILGSASVTPQTSTSTTLLCSNAGVISTCDSSLLSPTATNFIKNQTGQQASANFNISGTGIATTLQGSTSVLTALVDAATASTALNIGTTNANAINLNQNVTVAANKSLTLAGGTTANRPASPTEGMLWYDTTTKQLLVYANGAWQADRNSSTKIVAASNASQALKDGADYVATGTGDQAQINAALTAAAGGRVYLTEGTYTINASISIPNNTTLAGAGAGAVITIANSFNTSIDAITNTTTGGNGTGITIQDLRLDGNKANQTSGTINGIYLNGVGSGYDSSAIAGAKILNVRVNNWRGYGVYLNASSNNTLTGSTVQGNSSYGIYLYSSSNNTLSGNIAQGNSYGIALSSSTSNTLTGNTAQGNDTYGVYLNASSNNTLTGSTFSNNGGSTQNDAIYLTGSSSSNTIANNSITDSSATTTNRAIYIASSSASSTYLADNTLGGGTVNDAGTGTIYSGQFYNSTNYRIQPATNITMGSSTTTTTLQGNTAVTLNATTGTTMVCQNASSYLSACDSSILTPTATNFIRNGTSQQASSNFNISGTGVASILQAGTFDTNSAVALNIGTTNATGITLGKSGVATTTAGGLLTSSVDTATATTLNIGATNATTINLNKGTTLAAGMSLTINGGNTSTRPAGVEGKIYYDTETKQLLTYSNGKWQADRNSSTKIVAASNASQALKDGADYVATGTGDQAQINSALTAAAGGKVYLTEGTFTINASISVPNNTTLAGAGAGTIITIPNSYNTNINAITNTTTGGNGTGITIQDMKLDGNAANQTSGTGIGVYMNGAGSGSTIPGATIRNMTVNNWMSNGIALSTSANSTVSGSTFINNIQFGLTISTVTNSSFLNNLSFGGTRGLSITSSSYNTFSGNTIQGASGSAISLQTATNNTITGNSVQSSTYGITLASTSTMNTVTGNTINGSTLYGLNLNSSNTNILSANSINGTGGNNTNNAIYLVSSNKNTISGNTIDDGNSNTTNYAINISDSASAINYLIDNTFNSTVGNSTIYDAGTGTVYSNQSRAENGGQITNRTANDTQAFAVQSAAGVNVLAVDSTNSKVLVAGTLDTTTGTTLTLGSATATAISIGKVGITTTILGSTSVTPQTSTSTTLLCSNAGVISTCDSAVLAPTATNFIKNQTGQQALANFNISGTGVATTLQGSTSVLTPLVDAATASTALNIGTTNANAINLNQNVAVAAGKSLTLAGGTTANRPASPTEGMMWYDTTTKQLLVYSNGAWQADRNSSTKIVAASNSSQSAKDSADYVTTGTNDQTIINNALTAAAGGKVYLMEGTYTIGASISVPNNTTLAGAGAGTVITIPNSFNADINAITNTTTGGNGTGVTIQDLTLEGNKANQTSSIMYGVYFNGVGSTTISGGKVSNIWSNNWRTGGIALWSGSANNIVTGNSMSGNAVYGIVISGGSNNAISSNMVINNGIGLQIGSGSSNTISNNTFQSNGTGINTSSGNYNSIIGNIVRNTTANSISFFVSSISNTVSGNNIYNGGSATTNNGIYVDASSSNTITGNSITDTSATTTNYAINIINSTSNTNYLADNTFRSTPGTSTINDAGTGTVYANQSRAENGAQLTNRTANDTRAFTVQTTAGADVFAVDTTNSKVLVAGTLDTTTATTLSIGNASATSIVVGNTSGTAGISLSSSSITLGSVSAATLVQAATQSAANTAGNAMTIQGSTGQGSGNGGAVTIQAGNGGATGLYGGNLTLSGGTGTTSNGTVILATSTFQTATTDANCFPGGTESSTTTNCTISQNSINNNASVIVGFTSDAQTAFMPDPSILTAGRVVYVTASNGSKDFTLSVNGGGQGNQISMRKNTTATMIWNGADWTAAGASSSTTMQAAYDNTLQSAGGAELVVSKTSATNGLTIRDSTVNSVNGALLTVQSSSAANLFSVNSNVTEYTTDSGAEVAGASASTFPANTWTNVNGSGTSTVTRYTTAGNNIATGQGSVSVATTGANDGVKNILSTTLTPNMHYNVSFTTRLASSTFTNMTVDYSRDGTTASLTACAANQTSTTSIWTKVNCTFTAPASGITGSNAILIRQATGVVRTFYVDNISITIAADYNLATDGGVDDAANFTTNWTTVSAATVSQSTTVGNDTSDSAQVVTTATAGQGVRNKLSINPLASTLYRITVYAASSNTFNDFTVRYSRDGGTNFVSCADYNTQIISTSTSAFTKVTCYVTTDGTAASNPYVYFTQAAGTARTFYVDTFSMNLSSNSTPNVQVGGGVNGGPTTLFTVDRGASAPIASNNDALLGSMYYDTTLGKLQCYEADGWGACGSSPDNIITISPEYTNAVLHGTGIGTMTSDLCSDYLDINDPTNGPAICGAGETYNFYKWTSPQASDQKYSIYVTYQLPSTFKSFNSGQTSLQARVDSTANAYVKLQLYKNHSGLTPCGVENTVTTAANTWQAPIASGTADPSTCGFAPGDSVIFKITVGAKTNANAYVGNLNFAFSNK